MARLRLTLACGDYDRTRSLQDGSVRPDGIELTCLPLPVEETFFRMIRHREFEVAELSLSSYVHSLQADPPPFVALPVFVSRMFRHGSIFINAEAGIATPEDLCGKEVGAPEYQLTAGVWIRGILADYHRVPVDSVTYRTGGQERPGRIEKAWLNLPDRIRIEPIGREQTLSQMLASGEIDALYTPRIPRPFAQGDPRVERLFPDVIAAEKAYFGASGIFPIMHVVVVRRDIYQA
ncbi:MAG: ABC transporter substrate-binding protein, partial [Actinomycetota bacterium]|nr:ABC transporter substrate-binding protein [Actinomycetota bacterium]